MAGVGDFPMNSLGRLVSVLKTDGSSVRGFFMQCKPDRVYISIVDRSAHEWVALKDIESVVWE